MSVNIIGHALTRQADVQDELHFTYRGRVETVWQALFMAGIGAVVWYVDWPRPLAWFLFCVGGFLLLGGLANCLEGVDLWLNPRQGTWRVRRGLRFMPARAEGSLSDFSALVLAVEHAQLHWVAVLYPRGSYRGYALFRLPPEEKETAEVAWKELGSEVGVLLSRDVPIRPSEEERQERLTRVRSTADAADPPPENRTRVTPIDDGYEIVLASRFSKETVRILPAKLQWIYSLFGREWSPIEIQWRDVTEIAVQTVTRVAKGGTRRASWYLRRDWRMRMNEWWQARAAELKRPAGPVPFMARFMFFFEEFPFRTVRALTVRSRNSSALTVLGNEKKLGEQECAWLESVLVKAWRASRSS